MDFKALTSSLTSTIIEAGAAIMTIYNSDFAVYEKNDDSPVTEADRLGEDIITKALMEITPDIPVVGEEAKSEGQCPDISGNIFWLVDPLDGTKEFIKKGSDFTVNIGLIKDGTPIFGLVYAPAMGTLYGGTVGEGAWRADVKNGEVSEKTSMSVRKAATPLTIVASKSHRSETLENWLSHFPDAEHVSIGSSLKLCLVATGEADLYPRLGPTCEWDTAAAHAVLLAAGGSVTVAGGAPLTYGKDLTTFLNPYFLCQGDASIAVPDIS